MENRRPNPIEIQLNPENKQVGPRTVAIFACLKLGIPEEDLAEPTQAIERFINQVIELPTPRSIGLLRSTEPNGYILHIDVAAPLTDKTDQREKDLLSIANTYRHLAKKTKGSFVHQLQLLDSGSLENEQLEETLRANWTEHGLEVLGYILIR